MPSESSPARLRVGLGVLDVWALGVGIVVCGQYFGWNLGLRHGPAALGLASLIVYVLFLAWVFALAELSVAMPFAGGPLAYGRRASGPALGFVMAWSMFLECFFGLMATALAVGGYVAFLVHVWTGEPPSNVVSIAASLLTVITFFVLQVLGVREQSLALTAMTVGALLVLVLFWVIAAQGFSWSQLTGGPVFPEAPAVPSVLQAIPYALWWLIVIEGVALAAEETHDPPRTIPRGLALAMLTIGVMSALTVVLSCGAMSWRAIEGDYPLATIAQHVLKEGRPWLLSVFALLALLGLTASYHALLYSVSRQLFSLGRAGYLPRVLGLVHANRRTPVLSLLVCSLVITGGVVLSIWKRDLILEGSILVAGMTSLLWYVPAMGCLMVLRRRQPELFQAYRAPLSGLLPWIVIGLSLLALSAFLLINVKVVPFTLALYGGGLAYHFLWARKRLRRDAPEEAGGVIPLHPLPTKG